MWWNCDIQVYRTILRLKMWARSEHEARNKIQRMYLAATIQDLWLAESNEITFPRITRKAKLLKFTMGTADASQPDAVSGDEESSELPRTMPLERAVGAA